MAFGGFGGGGNKPLFGQTSTPTFGSSAFGSGGGGTSLFGSSTPATGAAGAFGAAAAPSGTGLFGTSTPVSGFGAAAPAPGFGAPVSGFGAAAPASGFGASAPTSGFGALAQGSGFGQAPKPTFGAPGSGFGAGFGAQSAAAPSGFGGGGFGSGFGAAQQQQVNGTRTVPYQITTERNSNHSGSDGNYVAITAMPQYSSKCIEELRVEDYANNDRGSPRTTSAAGGGGLYGNAQAASPFGQQPQSSSGLFGAAPSQGGSGLFGATPGASQSPFAQSQTSSGLFGAPAQSSALLFGQSAPAQPGFGGTAQSGAGVFGAPQSAPSLFGGGATGGSGGFGSGTTGAAGAFGTGNTGAAGAFGGSAAPQSGLFGQSGGSLFGGGGTSSSGGLFGAQSAPATGFGTGFGATSSAAPSSNIFGAKPSTGTGLFGAPSTGAATFGASSGGLFGASTPAFGAKPATGAFGLGSGAATGTGGLFGSTAQSGGGLFGASSGSGLWGGTSSGGGLFGGSSGGAFGLGANLGFGGSGGISSGLGSFGAQQAQPLAPKPLQASVNEDPFGSSQLYVHAEQALRKAGISANGVKTENGTPAKPAVVVGKLRAASNSTAHLAGTRPPGAFESARRALGADLFRTAPNGNGAIFQMGSTTRQQARFADSGRPRKPLAPWRTPKQALRAATIKKLVIEPLPAGSDVGSVDGARAVSIPNGRHAPSRGSVRFEKGDPILPPEPVQQPSRVDDVDVSAADEGRSEAEVVDLRKDPSLPKPTPRYLVGQARDDSGTPHVYSKYEEFYRANVASPRRRRSIERARQREVAEREAAETRPPFTNRLDIETRPPLHELAELSRDELRHVKDFAVIRQGIGEVQWYGETDVAGLDIDRVVDLRFREIRVYPSEEECPPVGTELNKRAVVKLHGIWKKDRMSRMPMKDSKAAEAMIVKLKSHCEKEGLKFIDYEVATGTWTFEAQRF